MPRIPLISDSGGDNDQVQSLFGLDQHCESLIMPLSAFGGVADSIRKEKFRGGIGIFVKVEICLFVCLFFFLFFFVSFAIPL